MKFDVFSGFRRISIVIATLWMAGWVIAGFMQSTYVHPYVLVPGFNQKPPFIIESSSCKSVDATDFFHVVIDGENLSGTACFQASKANNGKLLIPYASGDKPDTVLMDEKYSAEVRSYTQNYVLGIEFLPTQIEIFKTMKRDARWQQVINCFVAGIVGVAIIFVATFVIGWIARGFIKKPV